MRVPGPLTNSPADTGSPAANTRRASARGRGGRGNGNRGNDQGVLPPATLMRNAWKEYRDTMTKTSKYIPGWKKGDNWTRYLSHISSTLATVACEIVVVQTRPSN